MTGDSNVFEIWTENYKLDTFVKLFEIQDKNQMKHIELQIESTVQQKFSVFWIEAS